MLKKENRIYLWVIITLCGLISGSVGLTSNSVGIFYSVVSKDLDVLTGTFIGHNTFACLMLAVVALFVPKMINGKNFRKVISLGVLLCAISASLMSRANSLVVFYVLGILRGTGTAFFAFVVVSIIINHWFYKNHGLITSIIFASSGIAGAIFSPFLSSIIENYGWRNGYLMMGVLIVLCSLPFMFSKFTLYPEDMGLKPYGGEKLETLKKESVLKYNKKAYIYLIVFSASVHLASSMMQHVSSLAVFKGFSLSLSAFVVSCSMFGNILFKFLSGGISDKKGVIFSNSFMIIITTFAAISMLFINSLMGLSVASFIFGAVYAETAVGLVLLTKEYFDADNYDKVYPLLALVGNGSFAIGGTLIGFLYDGFNSYNIPLLLVIVLLIICESCLILCKKLNRKV